MKISYLVSEPNFHTTGFLTEGLLALEMKKKLKYYWVEIMSLFI